MKKYIFILTIAMGLYSCDMDTNPTDAVSEDIVFENAKNASYVLDGTWALMMDTYYTYANPGWSTILLGSDAMSSDVAIQKGKYGYYGHYSFDSFYSKSAYSAQSVWALAYRVINNTNALITRIDGVPGEEQLKKHIKSQTLALRGYLYLNLAMFYAPAYQHSPEALCVPIYLEPTTQNTKGNPRSTVAEVYKQAEEDLLEALTLSEGFKRDGVAKHKMDAQVIAGVLARLYLHTMTDWNATLKYAELAQKDSEWMSKGEYLAGFNDKKNKEWIWGHGQSTDQSTASYSFNYKDVSSDQSYYYSFFADPYFKEFFKDGNDYDTNDIRVDLFEWDVKRHKGGLMYKKFIYRSDKTADIVLMRKAEMKLIEAEALAEQGKLADAITQLNELRAARGAAMPDLARLNKEELIDEIMIERRKELFGEGFGLTDIKRRQNVVVRKDYPAKTPVPGYKPAEGEAPIYIVGHSIRTLPNRKPNQPAFEKNSEYYNISIPAQEETNNPNL